MLQKPENHWTRITLAALKRHNTGFAKQIAENLIEWGLESEWANIKKKSAIQWKREVNDAAEKKNKEKLQSDCYKKERGMSIVKSKTEKLIPILESDAYVRQPQPYMTKNKIVARAFIMGQFGMLQCASNYSNGHGTKNCKTCEVVDDESHRINVCPVWGAINLSNSVKTIDYNQIYSDDENESRKVVDQILAMWDLGNNKNCMRTLDTPN